MREQQILKMLSMTEQCGATLNEWLNRIGDLDGDDFEGLESLMEKITQAEAPVKQFAAWGLGELLLRRHQAKAEQTEGDAA